MEYEKRVARLMAENDLQAERPKRRRVTTLSDHDHRASPNRMGTNLTLQALFMAIMRTGYPSGVTFHSDRGVQYASKKLRGLLGRYGFRQSMSRKGNCWDTAVMESFFAMLKGELIAGRKYPTRQKAIAEIFYNRTRIHSYGSHAA